MKLRDWFRLFAESMLFAAVWVVGFVVTMGAAILLLSTGGFRD